MANESSTLTLRHAATSALLCAFVFLASPSVASAHASLQTTDPSAGSIVAEAPTTLTLQFTEPIDTVPESLRLFTADGSSVDIGETEQDAGSRSLTARLPALDDGSYVVAWRAVSVDSHPINGAFTFSVGAATDTAPGLVEDLVEGERSSDGQGEVWLGIGRWSSFAGLAILVGAPLLLLVGAPDRLDTRRAQLVLAFAGLVAAAGTILMIGAQASLSTGNTWSRAAWAAVFDSRAGRWWLARLPLVAIGLLLLSRRQHAKTTWWRAGALAVATLSCAIYAAGGHAMSGRAQAIGFIATVAHLAAMSVWVGGLVAVVTIVGRERLLTAAQQFSPLALGAVAVLAASGGVNGWRQMGSIDGFTDSVYGRWLLVKLTLVVAVVAVAGVSRWVVRTAEAPHLRLGALRRTTLVEVVGIAVILAATAGLVNAAPPAGPPVEATSVSVVEGDRIAQLILDPAVTGGTVMHVYISSPGGLLDRPDEITVEASLPSQQLGPLTIPTFAAGPDHVTTNDADIPLTGLWTFTITARYGEFDQVVFTAQMVVS